MKKLYIASGMVALLAAATSCDKYDIYPEEFDSVFAIRDAGTRKITVYSTDEMSEVPFVVMKGGYDPETSSTATLKVMSGTEFDEYRENSGNTLYAAIGNECYSFSKNENEAVHSVNFTFDSADKKYDYATLYVRPARLKQWMDTHAAEIDGYTPCVPVILESATDTVSSYNNVTLVCLEINTPTLSLDVDGVVGRTVNKKTMGNGVYVPEGNISIPCANPWGFKVNLNDDAQLLTDYNTANNTHYVALPAEAYTLNKTLTFAPGTTYQPLGLTIDLNQLQEMITYAIAVKLDDEQPIVWDSDNNPGSALEVNTDGVVIYTVRVVDAVVLKKVNLSESNVTANDKESSEGSIGALFDDNTDTYYHSDWHGGNNRTSTYGSYLEITLPKAMSIFRFDMTTRDSPTAAGYAKKVRLFGTNDLNNWPTEPFAEIDDMNQLLNGAKVSASFGTDEEPFMAEEPYLYLRLCVMESGGGTLTEPSTRYWCASGLTLYGNH